MRKKRILAAFSIIFGFLVIYLPLLFFAAAAAQKPDGTYPEHGTVVAIHGRTKSVGMVVGGGANHPVVAIQRGSSRIATKTRFYDLEDRGKRSDFSVGQEIDFRVTKNAVFVKEPNGKEKKYRIVGEELKTDN